MSGRAFSYFADTPGLPLSLKCMSNGRALYNFGRAEDAVDDSGYLILNDRQPYSIEIASPTLVETFVLWFPHGWAEEVLRSFDETPETLLGKSPTERTRAALVLRAIHAARPVVSPKVRALRAAFKGKHTIEDGWLEEKLRELLAAMLASQHALNREVRTLPAVRPSTREELWRRVNRAPGLSPRAFGCAIALSEVAAAACLSPFHLLRVFRSGVRRDTAPVSQPVPNRPRKVPPRENNESR